MAKISISDLRPAGAEVFSDELSFLQDLTQKEVNATHGGYFRFSIETIEDLWDYDLPICIGPLR